MNVSVGARWENFVSDIVRQGRHGSASEVVREGLRLVEEREAKRREERLKKQARALGFILMPAEVAA